ncbi:MAG: hypothetical protein ACO32J_04160 [Phycisphaerales bacterium]
MSPNPVTNLFAAVRAAPMAWVAAAACAALPLAMMVAAPSLRDRRVPDPSAEQAALTRGSTSDSWFSSADNPFLTEEQSRERRMRSSVGRVEDVIRRRPDVREVTILARAADGRSGHITAVATIAMRHGVVPISLVDATGSLLAAAVHGLQPQDVVVIDEGTGIRARATGMDLAAGEDGRGALQEAADRAAAQPAPVLARAAGDVVPPPSAISREHVLLGAFTALVAGAMAWVWWRSRTPAEPAVEPSSGAVLPPPQAIPSHVSLALHRNVADRTALVGIALVERLERGGSAHEVAQLLLNMEPWAAERLLKSMPSDCLAKIEAALRDPSVEASSASVRALAEAVLSVRNAA